MVHASINIDSYHQTDVDNYYLGDSYLPCIPIYRTEEGRKEVK